MYSEQIILKLILYKSYVRMWTGLQLVRDTDQ
jgi:hypothetical protein